MKVMLKSARFIALVVLLLFGTNRDASAQLVITEIMYNPSTFNDNFYEWFEVRNDGATPIDLDGVWIAGSGDEHNPLFHPQTISASNNSTNTTTVIQPGQLAVIYDGDVDNTATLHNFNADSFRTTWNVPANIPVIAGDRFPFLRNHGENDTIGLWTSSANLIADATETEPGSGIYNVTSFNNTLASFEYGTGGDWPTGSSGVSIQWDGVTAPRSDGTGWHHSVASEQNASLSNALLSNSIGMKNSTADLGSPGVVPAGSATAGLLITEIMYNPASNDSEWEWIEVHNNTGAVIDFGSTGYVIDDGNNTAIGTANITSGSIPQGGTAVLFSGDDNNLADMQTAWGAGVNFISVANFEGLNNNPDDTDDGSNDAVRIDDGFNEVISIWNSHATYQADFANENAANALVSIQYGEFDIDADANTTDDNWFDPGAGSSLYLSDLSLDPSLASSWIGAGGNGDFNHTFNAMPVPTEGNAVLYAGGDVGSPGYFTALPEETLLGDFNADGIVNAADYTVWRDNFGQDALALNGNGSGEATVVAADYDLWANSYGNSSNASSAATVPEPTAAMLLFAGMASLVRRRAG